jgi:hypothetical protein
MMLKRFGDRNSEICVGALLHGSIGSIKLVE